MSILSKMKAFVEGKRVEFELFGERVFLHPPKPDVIVPTQSRAAQMAEAESVLDPSLKAKPYKPTAKDKADWLASDAGAEIWAEWEATNSFPKTIYDVEMIAFRTSIFTTLWVIQQIHTPEGAPIIEGDTERKRNDSALFLVRAIRGDAKAREAITKAQEKLQSMMIGAKEAAMEMNEKAAKKKAAPKPRPNRKAR